MAQKRALQNYINNALDRAYVKHAGAMLSQIKAMSVSPSSEMAVALRALDEEVARLEEEKKPLTSSNPVLKNALAVYTSLLVASASLIKASDNAIQSSGQIISVSSVTAKVFRSVTGSLLQQGIDPMSPKAQKAYANAIAKLGAKWVTPKNAADFAKDFVETVAWTAKMEKWGRGYAELTKNTLLQGLQNGWGPKYTASQMRQYAQNIPVSAAENITRTLQLTSYREASRGMEILNGGFIEYKIRISALALTSCLSCISLHGTRLEVGERVDDHAQGFCSEIYITPGGDLPEFMQADSQPGARNFVKFQDGPTWFAGLSPERQAAQASFASSPAKLAAYRAGTPLSDFVTERMDDVFGRQVMENSLLGMLGEGAEKYYVRNQP